LPSGQRTDYAPAFSTSVKAYSALKLGPGGYMYAAVNFPFIFRIPPGGGTSERWFPGGGGVGKIFDFDFDQQGNIWGGGNNTAIYRIKADKSSRAFPFVADVRSVRVFNGYVYAACQTFPDSLQKIVRFQLMGDSLGPAETYFDFSAAYPAGGVYALTFADDGDMFVGTDSVAGTVVLVHPDRTSERFYPGWFTSRIRLFAYGATTEMYAIRTGPTDDEKRMMRIFTQKTGAPYYGRP
jgi:hypothetical protein